MKRYRHPLGRSGGSSAGLPRRLWRRVNRFHDELFVAPWRAAVAREVRREEEALLALLFLEALGVPGPADYYALELYPDLIQAFHEWHRRMGMDRFPEPGVCC